MDHSVDLAASLVALSGVAVVLVSFAWAVRARRAPCLAPERIEQDGGSIFLGKATMVAGYRIVPPVARALLSLGIHAHAVTLSCVVFATGAAACFARGHFGVGASLAAVAAMGDAIDGFMAREAGSASLFGKMLDTVVDRYVEAVLLAGICLHVRENAILLLLALAALVGSFMVSYASSLLRELGGLGRDAPRGGMRRAERAVYVIGGAMLVPIVDALSPVTANSTMKLAPLLCSLTVVAVVGNVSAVARLIAATRPRPEPQRFGAVRETDAE